jgi:GDP-L-fucose synthase
VILVTGATGFVGKRVSHLLEKQNKKFMRTSLSLGLDLRDPVATNNFFEKNKIEQIINCAAFVGGIQFGYKHPVELFQNNMLMTVNLLAAAQKYGVKRIVNPISNCAYPAKASLFKEEEFWDGPLHESVLVYGFVRKASWVGSWAYNKQYGLDVLNLIVSNMYGPEDHFEEERSHALGALIMKFVKAKKENLPQVTVWGTGAPVREWLHVDDGAEALVRGLEAEAKLEPVNVGVASGISIKDLALLIKEVVGYKGEMVFDTSKPDGAPYKTVEGSKGQALLRWRPGIQLEQGVKDTVEWYLKHGH